MNQQLQALNQQYIHLARNAAGVGPVVGGGLFLVAYFAGGSATLELWSRFLLASTPFLYVFAREVLRSYYYQYRYQRASRSHRSWQWILHTVLTAITALASLGIIASVVLTEILAQGEGYLFSQASPWPVIGYVVFLLAIPVLVWFYLWTVEDYILGFLLIMQASVVLNGRTYPLNAWPLALVTAILMIALGLLEHRRYRLLKRQLQALQRQAQEDR